LIKSVSVHGNQPFVSTSDRISEGGATERPPTATRWQPTPSLGLASAISTASSKASPFAISVSLVRMPLLNARRMPALTPRVKPKSSALTINRFIRDQRSEVRGQRTEIRGHKSEVRGQKSEVRSQK